MAGYKTVTIFPPTTGRSTNIKVTMDTTILQVIEEACKKFNLNPDEYDLKYHKKILDVNLIFRHANEIANNAKLDLVLCKTPRQMSNVKICLALENGERKESEFFPDVNIKKVLNDLNVEYDSETTIIYLRRQIPATDFEATTLKSLGLMGGRGLFRLSNRDPNQSKEQAHVYTPPVPKTSKTEEDEDPKRECRPVPIKAKTFNPIAVIRAEKGITKTEENTDNVKSENASQDQNLNNTPMEVCSENSDEQAKVIAKDSKKTDDSKDKILPDVKQEVKKEYKELQYEFLGEREALLFNLADAEALPQTDESEDFYELTVRDAINWQRERKKQLEDKPLLTEAQRKSAKDQEQSKLLEKHEKTTIRIYFPNQLVLQGTFASSETVQEIKNFVKNYLQSTDDFELYTTPPINYLDPTKRLIDEDLVPQAKVYYSGKSDLKPDIKLTDPAIATLVAKKKLITAEKDNSSLVDESNVDMEQASTSQPKPPTAKTRTMIVYDRDPNTDQSQQQQTPTKVPKWFKPSKK